MFRAVIASANAFTAASSGASRRFDASPLPAAPPPTAPPVAAAGMAGPLAGPWTGPSSALMGGGVEGGENKVDNDKYAGKWLVVTGGTSGVGLALAASAAARGMHLLLLSRGGTLDSAKRAALEAACTG